MHTLGVCSQRTAAAEWSPRAGMETAVLGPSVVLMGGDHDVPIFSSAGECICVCAFLLAFITEYHLYILTAECLCRSPRRYILPC